MVPALSGLSQSIKKQLKCGGRLEIDQVDSQLVNFLLDFYQNLEMQLLTTVGVWFDIFRIGTNRVKSLPDNLFDPVES